MCRRVEGMAKRYVTQDLTFGDVYLGLLLIHDGEVWAQEALETGRHGDRYVLSVNVGRGAQNLPHPSPRRSYL